jgi:excisionase family DNA binding protein
MSADATSTIANRLLTAAEVSEILRVPRSTVYELARARRIPFLKVGRRTLFDPELLREWIARQNVPPRG